MSRRRKGKGGRVTPKGTRPQNWDTTPAAVMPLPPSLDPFLPRFNDELALLRDTEASIFVAAFPPRATQSNVVQLFETETEEESATAEEVLQVLAEVGPHPPQRLVDAVVAFATYGGTASGIAKRMLRSYTTRPSAAVAYLGQATVSSTLAIEDIFGESVQYLFALTYPDGSTGGLAILVDSILGGVVRDTMVMPDTTTFTDLFNEADEFTSRPETTGKAATIIDRAYEVNDQTIDIQFLVEDDVAGLRPLVEKALARVSRQEVDEPESITLEARDQIVNEFVEWTRANHPTVSDDVLSWSRLAIDFAVDHGHGDPIRWGPKLVQVFLEWSTYKVMAPPDELRQIPDLLRLFVPWAHDQVGWGEQHVDQVMEAIDNSIPFFEEALSDPAPRSFSQEILQEALAGADLTDPDSIGAAIEQYNLGLEPPGSTVPPVGGSHPEPFDPSGLGPATERATTVSELASASARAIFDDEFVTLVRRLTADAAMADPVLFARGQADIWASGVVYALAQLNEIIGGWNAMALSSDELTSRLAGAPGTISNKAAAVRSAVGESRWSLSPRYQHSATQFYRDEFEGGLGLGAMGGGRFGELASRRPPPSIVYDRLPKGSAFVLRCELDGLSVWRTIQLPASSTLFELHLLLQRIFDWEDYHLHQFTVGGQGFTSNPDSEWDMIDGEDQDDAEIRLDELVRAGAVFSYVYDFGDNWQVQLKVEEFREPERDRAPFDLLDGAGDAPPEDCGGVWGYENLVNVLANPKDPEFEEMSTWAGDFRPGSFDLQAAAAQIRSRTQ